ncbi:dCMP deaminase family protein [Mycoplasma zalophi]|uniref:deoxycytidylate deaminase n=1 Tax=Mycoplasma zalophi TaxID=191287 RepID=UPI0021C5F774|nr:dCMP deaminase family protein [Mycoplasma zalophi]MCU4117322.1 dCMP deaminase family protein [Mycoplasma zalophi]
MKKIFLTENGSLKWDYYFMSLAKLSAMRSKDPTTKVGACIVSDSNHVISVGYNGMPKVVSEVSETQNIDNDKIFSWDRPKTKDDIKNSKYTYVVHAEANAIINANLTNSNIKPNSTIYITHSPCFNCAKLIVQSKITRVVYANEYRNDSEEWESSLYILKSMGVELIKLERDFDINITEKE